jgi:hypothetical protein
MCMTDTESQEEWCDREQCATLGNDVMNSCRGITWMLRDRIAANRQTERTTSDRCYSSELRICGD